MGGGIGKRKTIYYNFHMSPCMGAKDAEIEKLKAEIVSLKEKLVIAEAKIEKDEVVETKTE